jgi:PAS domain S-box-containing protein
MTTAILWLILFLLGLALIISVATYIAVIRRRTAEVQLLAESLSREAAEHRKSDERYRLLVENAPDAIVSLDREGRFTSMNPFCERLTGWPREEWIGRPFLPLVHADDLPGVKESFANALIGMKTPMADIRVLSKAGDFVWMEFIMTPEFQGRQVKGVLAIGRDISARQKAERAQAALELQVRRAQKMEAIGRLAGGIAHDFNNFLSVIMANCGLARMDLVACHPAVERLEQIDRASKRAAALVHQILTFSRAPEQERSVMHLKTVVKEAAVMLRSVLPRSVEIRTLFAPHSSAVLADSGQIQQVIMNLATNGAYAMKERGGVLEISLDQFEVDEEFIARNPDLQPGPHVRLTVSDTGQGMDTATLERIFEPFFTTKPQGEGTGLGLSVVHGIVKGHQAAINVYSEIGRGTSFKIYFPAAIGTEHAGHERQLSPIPHGDGEHILLIDDEPSLVECGQRMLQRLGYRVTAVQSAGEALDLIRGGSHEFDCILTDLDMPEITGISLARECRGLLPEIPVILMSGYWGVTSPDLLRSHGIHDLVLKPFTPHSLAEAVRRALVGDKHTNSSN